jgi:hypothetical protein
MIPLSDIVLIVIRILVLNWALWILATLASSIVMASQTSNWSFLTFLPSCILLVFAIIGWTASPTISKIVTPKKDYAAHLGGLSRRDLYSFSFVFLGLYFTLTSFSATIISAYFAIFSSQLVHKPIDASSMRDLFRHAVTFIVGFFVLVSADRWARLLLAKEASNTVEQDAAANP